MLERKKNALVVLIRNFEFYKDALSLFFIFVHLGQNWKSVEKQRSLKKKKKFFIDQKFLRVRKRLAHNNSISESYEGQVHEVLEVTKTLFLAFERKNEKSEAHARVKTAIITRVHRSRETHGKTKDKERRSAMIILYRKKKKKPTARLLGYFVRIT